MRHFISTKISFQHTFLCHILLLRCAAICLYTACFTTTTHANSLVVQQTSDAITASNQTTQLQISKTNGNLASLIFNGQELLGNDGHGYMDLHSDVAGGFRIGHHETSATSYSVSQGSDWIDLAIHHSATATTPYNITHHYVMRENENGFHWYSEYNHPITNNSVAIPADTLAQTRFVIRGDHKLFNHHGVQDQRLGAVMPTYEQLQQGSHAADATTDLLNVQTDYPKRYYTKYDYSVYQKDHTAHGMYGDEYGIWMVMANRESLNGGPMKQNNTVHAGDTPILLGVMQSGHYGAASVDAKGTWNKTYGPYYVHLTETQNNEPNQSIQSIGESMLHEAEQYAAITTHQDFYDQLEIKNWVQTQDRITVTGQINLQSASDSNTLPKHGATIVLSDNQTDFQHSSQGYQYWVDTHPDGSFTLPNVRPGTYRLSAYADGVFDELQIDDVTIHPNQNQDLGTIVWKEPAFGTTLWTLGTANRTAEEFRNGDDYRQFALWDQFNHDFSNGVAFTIGQSQASQDWNHAQWRRINGQTQAPWHIRFDLPDDLILEEDAQARLTIAVAASRLAELEILINGQRIDIWDLPVDSSVAHRSGISGYHHQAYFEFDANLLKQSGNDITLRLIGRSDVIMYDALRLEIQGQLIPEPSALLPIAGLVFIGKRFKN